ncbi:hypothetical protein COLSTE_00304 [Collinsella stercoris DSM 13279]|uniref:Uncharacterized protein n=1 Tax=Collinsella stercoris DSM 13279 TaxID=445975 RepID=B6G8B4_9ACTN|nr:hypothetical protein COLSTE_00304 [Collinsella stercoris DSM 13279]
MCNAVLHCSVMRVRKAGTTPTGMGERRGKTQGNAKGKQSRCPDDDVWAKNPGRKTIIGPDGSGFAQEQR